MRKKIVAVTACATGVAHTFMAAAALKKGAKELGHLIKVETQGAIGIENAITDKDLEIADIVIWAVDTKVREDQRFRGRKVYEVPVSAPIKNAKKVIEDALNS
jgi:PTS system fructose-specific IIB component